MFSSIVDRDFFVNLVRLAGDAAHADGATLFTLDKSGRFLKPFVVHKLPESYIAGIGLVEVGTQCCGRAVAQKKPWIVTDMLSDPLFKDGVEGAKSSDIRAGFSVPVMTQDGDVLGSLACHYRERYTPSLTDLERNKMFASLIAYGLKETTEQEIQRNDWRMLLDAALQERDRTLLAEKIERAQNAILDRLEISSIRPADQETLCNALRTLRELELNREADLSV